MTRPGLRILSWNIHASCGIAGERLARISDAIRRFDADIVLLQEVFTQGDVPERLRDQLEMAGWYFSGLATSAKRYGNAIASRHPLHPCEYSTTPHAPWPELLACARVSTPAGAIEVVSVHMPNGSGHGWKKIEAFEALASLLAHAQGTPWIVGGDFNEPRAVLSGNRIVSFGADDNGEVRGTWRGQPAARWQTGVESVLGANKRGVHAWLSRNAGAALTHVVRGQERFFDHLLASEHFDVDDSGFEHAWREGPNAMSDHSGAWARLSMRDPVSQEALRATWIRRRSVIWLRSVARSFGGPERLVRPRLTIP